MSHKNEAIQANNMPSGSTLKCIARLEVILSKYNSGCSPFKTAGKSEQTIHIKATDVINVHVSLRLIFLRVNAINIMPIIGNNNADMMSN